MTSLAACLLGAGVLSAALLAPLAVADSGSSALRKREATLSPKLQDNAIGRPLYLESSEAADRASGDAYAELPHAFGEVAAALSRPEPWCDVLILHFNVKRCAPTASGVTLYVGGKYEQALEQAYRLDLGYTLLADTPDHLRVRLHADSGPLGTHDYGFEFEATPAAPGRTFIHFRYTVGYGRLASLVLHGYLDTIGRDKVGFSRVAAHDGEAPALVGGERGAVERNAMRYYLAIAAYLDSLTHIPSRQAKPRKGGNPTTLD